MKSFHLYHPRIVHLCNVKEVAPSKRLISEVLIYLFYLFVSQFHNIGVVFAFELSACMLVCLLTLIFCLSTCLFAYMLCYHFLFFLALLFCFVSLVVLFHRIVSHETMCDPWSKLGKVQEVVRYYHYLVICHPPFVWRTCYFQSMIHQWKYVLFEVNLGENAMPAR